VYFFGVQCRYISFISARNSWKRPLRKFILITFNTCRTQSHTDTAHFSWYSLQAKSWAAFCLRTIFIACRDGFGHKGSEVAAVECAAFFASFLAYINIYASLDEIPLLKQWALASATELGKLTLVFRLGMSATWKRPSVSPWEEERLQLRVLLAKMVNQLDLVFTVLDPSPLPGVHAVFPNR